MHRRHKYDLIVIFAIIGLSVSLYLTVSKYMGFAVPCTVTHGCETVLSSKYASVFGLPVSLWGMGFFSALILLSLLSNHYVRFRRWLTVWLGIGTLGALYFFALQFFVIKNICQYCVTTDSLIILLFLWDLNIEYRNPQLSAQ
jgi:uncharacterized membrane protein